MLIGIIQLQFQLIRKDFRFTNIIYFVCLNFSQIFSQFRFQRARNVAIDNFELLQIFSQLVFPLFI